MLDKSQSAGAEKSVEETEWQFDVPDLAAVERWLSEAGAAGEAGEISVGGAKTLRLTDLYYDTEDWRLYRAGYALRVRSRGKSSEATLKSLAEAGEDGIRRRREISESLSASIESLKNSDGQVGSRLRALIGARKLGELFEIRTRRLAYPLSSKADDGSQIVGELAVDETEIPAPDGKETTRLDLVEVEAGEGGTEALEAFVSGMRESCGLTPASVSKFGAGLRAHGLEPPGEPDFGAERIDRSLTLGEVAYAAMRRQLAAFLRHEPGTRLGEAEGIHDMRVASRRLRAVLQAFEPALAEWALRSEPELKHFASVLGEVRDLDVQLEKVGAWISDSPEEDRASLEELRGALQSEREAAQEKMLAELDSKRYERLVDTLSRTLRLGPPRGNRLSSTPVTEAAPDLVRQSYRRARKIGDQLGAVSPAGDYHKLRKRCKRLRYLLEFLEEVYGGPARKFAKRTKSLQDILGDLQDTEVARERLRRLATDSNGPDLSHAATFAIGGVAARQATEATRLRESFPSAYSGIKGKPWKKLEKVMQETRKKQKKKQ